jgi:NAD(P)-dependent dehydrogenase (short-subunit alcohol dehydrogenase family)
MKKDKLGDETVVIITGANNGIGFHMTESLLEKGSFRVAAFDLSCENLEPLLSRYAQQLLFCRCDVTDETNIQSAVHTVNELWGRIDVLVNNACICVFQSFEDRSVEQLLREFDINYFGYVRMIKAVLPHMKAQGRGIIHNVSSGVGITGFMGISGYASTKGAIESLTRTLSLEFSRYGIHVNIMHPPLTNTKSASPLGIPVQAMADPKYVGRKLAGKILSTRPVITPNVQTSIYLLLARRFPVMMGKLFCKLTENAQLKRNK